MRHWLIFFSVFAFLLAGCTPDATPFPVLVPTETATPTPIPQNFGQTPDAPQVIRYGVSQQMRFDLPQNSTVQLLTALDPAQLGSSYEVLLTYGAVDGWERAPTSHNVSIALNTNRGPLNTPAIADIVRRALNPQGLIAMLNIPGAAPLSVQPADPQALRIDLANAGYPDGFMLRVLDRQFAAGAAAVRVQLQALGLDVILLHTPTLTAPDAELFVWSNESVREAQMNLYGAENIIDLYSLPISYLAADGLTITFNADGLPEATR